MMPRRAPPLRYIRHAICDTEIEWRRVRDSDADTPTLKLWCPACQKVIGLKGTDGLPPFVAVRPHEVKK